MSLIMLAPLLGGAVGPAISGLIAESLGWRKILWMSAILAIVCEVLFFTLLRETYKVSILKHRATRLRRENQDESIKCPYESDEAASALYWSALRTSIKRPIVVMLDSSVLQILAFYGGLMFTLYYVLATTLPGILMEIYGFSPAQTGLSFMTFSKSRSPETRTVTDINRPWRYIRNPAIELLCGSHIHQVGEVLRRRNSNPRVPIAIHDYGSSTHAACCRALWMGS